MSDHSNLTCSCVDECQQHCDQFQNETDAVRSIASLDDCTNSLVDLVDSIEHDADIVQVIGRCACDALDDAVATATQAQTDTANTVQLLEFTVASCGGRLDQFDTVVHFGELTADAREELEEQGEATQAPVVLNYERILELESDYNSLDHHSHLNHSHSVGEQKQINMEQAAAMTSNDLWTEALHDIMDAHDDEFRVQR